MVSGLAGSRYVLLRASVVHPVNAQAIIITRTFFIISSVANVVNQTFLDATAARNSSAFILFGFGLCSFVARNQFTDFSEGQNGIPSTVNHPVTIGADNGHI